MATEELFPGSRRQDAIENCKAALLAACLAVGRAIAGRGGAVKALTDLFRACSRYVELHDDEASA